MFFQSQIAKLELKQNNQCDDSTENAIKYIIENIEENISLDCLEVATSISKFALTRAFKKRYGVTPIKWLWQLRTAFAAELLINSNARIIDIAIYTGFTSQAHLSRLLKNQFSTSPLMLRRKARESAPASDTFDIGKSLSSALAKVA